MSTLYNVKYDFVEQDGHSLVIYREEGIKSNQIDHIQVNMIKENQIDQLAPLHTEEFNMKVRLFYKTGSKRLLHDHLQHNKLTMKEFYQLLNKIITTLAMSDEYMLDADRFVLNSSFIFADDHYRQIGLVYLPIADIEKDPLHKELKELIFELVSHVSELTGNGVQQLTTMLQQENVSLEQMKKKIENLIAQLGNNQPQSHKMHTEQVREVEPNTPPYQEQVSTNQQQRNNNEPVIQQQAPPLKNTNQAQQRQQTQRKKQVQNRAKPQASQTQPPVQEEEIKKPTPVILGCIGAIGVMFALWMYLNLAVEGVNFIAAGVVFLTVALVYYLGKVKPTNDQAKINAQTIETTPKNTTIEEGIRSSNEDVAPLNYAQAGQVSTKQYYEDLSNQTTILGHENSDIQEENQTALLNEDDNEPKYWFEKIAMNKTETIELNTFPFVIGRDNNAVEYLEDSVGVSRRHIEINDQFEVKDLGSKNGTKLNGEKLVAYKTYSLQPEDKITIGKVDFIFKQK
ncbi:hypothetical protein J2T56_001417 [Natronobacillus azotifigens]|uniref:DUF6382 domain-containing protein n=1 Tax=Natronobacillus azotifigens TaxID=472978 RepID=A0A9J6RD58_9BACI|nr:DUF6382 domain-containing protein [Natronobacillus azotifigens]MCZ0703145.1 DUF6382 domain-containing protein [Natronobacillus azotifigens]